MSLPIPLSVLNAHSAVLGKTGAGKSSLIRCIVEDLIARDKRVCIVDPKGDWYGLKLNADGKPAGNNVITFGSFVDDDATDVPINEHSGKAIAELISKGNRPCVIGFRGWMPVKMTRFWIDFASTLFNSKSGELYVILDEAHNFAPKGKVISPQAGESLHWTNRILSEGRGLGLIFFVASQRPQKVHNDTLTCCETLFAMRVVHAADRSAIEEWIDGCGDLSHGKALLAGLAAQKRGQAYVWSPESNFGPELIQFPMFKTFDSFAPPQLQKKVSAKSWAGVDLDDIKAKLAKEIEEANANSPAFLRKEIERLKHSLKNVPIPADKPLPEIREVPFFNADERKELVDLQKKIAGLSIYFDDKFSELIAKICGIEKIALSRNDERVKWPSGKQELIQAGHRPAIHVPRGVLKERPTAKQVSDGSAVSGTQQKILDTIQMLGGRGLTPNRDMIARWLDIHPNGGRFGQDLAYLRAEGYIEGCLLIAGKGSDAANFRGSTGLDGVLLALDGTQQKIIEVLRGDRALDRDSLAAELGIHPNGGRFGQDLARLRTMGLIPERGTIKLTPAATL